MGLKLPRIISRVWWGFVLVFFAFSVQRLFIICVVFRVFIMRGEPEDTFVFSSISSLPFDLYTLLCGGLGEG